MRHYSRRTESTYVHWIRRFIVFHHKKHPDTIAANARTRCLRFSCKERFSVLVLSGRELFVTSGVISERGGSDSRRASERLRADSAGRCEALIFQPFGARLRRARPENGCERASAVHSVTSWASCSWLQFRLTDFLRGATYGPRTHETYREQTGNKTVRVDIRHGSINSAGSVRWISECAV
jgi:hypothetical protein